MPMKKFILSAAIGPVLLGVAGSAMVASAEGRRPDQDAAYAATLRGQVRPLREIEARIVPQMGGANYLGPEFDSDSGRYRLKFMRGGSVIWVDVDGRNGRVIGRSGD